VIVFYTNNINDGVENGFSLAAGGGSIHDDDSHNYELVIPGNGVPYIPGFLENTLNMKSMGTTEIEQNNKRNDINDRISSRVVVFGSVLPFN
jgi:hypothetical protein